MPISNYDRETFVAFLDIAGFKELMQRGNGAWKALDRLYQSGYDILRNQNQANSNRVDGIFVSDCGVLFVTTNSRNDINHTERLLALLQAVKRINQRMLESDFMLTTSIAYGRFKYQERIEFEGIEKNPMYGNAYVSAFLDVENGRPKIQPGQCRMVRKNLPENIISSIEEHQNNAFEMIRKRDGDNEHFYYYWMINEPNRIDEFEKEYKDTFNLKYAGMLKALKGDRHGRHIR